MKQQINIGVEGNDGTGDSIRGAFTKVNDNFDELYSVFGLEGAISISDLADGPLVDPDTNLAYSPDQIIMANSIGDRLTARSVVGGTNIEVKVLDTGELRISAPNTQLSSDPSPSLTYPLNANAKVIGNLPYPDDAAVALFNSKWGNVAGALDSTDTLPVTVKYAKEKFLGIYNGIFGLYDSEGNLIQPSLASEPSQPDITNANYDSTLSGNYLSNSIVPRKDLVYRGGDTLTGPLYLSSHPTPLSNITSTDLDDLQAATKFYVDNKTYASNINLFVSTTSGDDLQTNTPAGKEGRSWNYSYKTIGSALLHAQSLIELASQEPGPYKQRISYTQNADLYFSTIKKVSLTSGNTIGTNSIGYIAAYDLLQANRSFIQAETIAYINKKFVNPFVYTETDLKIKIASLTTAVADDLMYGAVSVSSSVPQLNYNSYQYAIEYIKTHTDSADLIQWNSIINFVNRQITDFSYSVPNLQSYTSNIVSALSYDFLFKSNYQSIQTGISFNTANTGITVSQLESMLEINSINILTSSYNGSVVTITFTPQLINNFPVGSQIVISGVFSAMDEIITLDNATMIVKSSTLSTISFSDSNFTKTSTYVVTDGRFDRYNLINQLLISADLISSGNTAVRSSLINNALLIVSIASGTTLPTVIMPVFSNAPALYNAISYSNAKDLLIANISFIQSEVISYLSAEFPTATYDRATCLRDVKYIVWSVAYDLMYGGNSQSVYSATRIKQSIIDLLPIISNSGSESWVASMGYINTLAQSIIQNAPVATVYQQSVKQYRNNSLSGGIIASTSISTNISSVIRIVTMLPNTPANVTLSVTSAGAITASAPISTLVVGQKVIISGSSTGTGTIPAGTYYIIATNGTSTFQLSSEIGGTAVVTSAGTLIGLSYVFYPFVSYANAALNSYSSNIIDDIPVYTTLTDSNESDGFATTTTPWFINHFYPVINDENTKLRIDALFKFITDTITTGSYPTELPYYPAAILSIYSNTSASELSAARLAIETSLVDTINTIYALRSATYKVADVSEALYKQYVKDVLLAVEYDITYGGSSATFAASKFVSTVDTSPAGLLAEIKSQVKSSANVGLIVESIVNGTTFIMNVAHQTTGNITFTAGTTVGLVGAVVAGETVVNLSEGNTLDLLVGNIITKTSGVGEFGVLPISLLIDAAFSASSTLEFRSLFKDTVPYKAADQLRTIIVSNSTTISNDTLEYVKSNFSGGFKYNESLCYRDVGSIVNALSIDIITGGTWQSINAGKSFYKNASGILVASGAQRIESLDGIRFAKDLSLQVLNKEYKVRYQSLVSQISAISNVNNLPSTAINVGRVGDTRLLLEVSQLAIDSFTSTFNSMISIVENGIGNAPPMITSMFGTGIWHVAVDNGGNGYVDQGKPSNIDLFPAKIISGVGKQSTNVLASTASASIVKYVSGQDTSLTILSVEDSTHFTVSVPHKTTGAIVFSVGTVSGLVATLTAGSTTVTLTGSVTVSNLNIGQTPIRTSGIGAFGVAPLGTTVDSIQVRLIRPDFFNLNEEVEFGETVRDLHITTFVESGIYYEDFPLRLSPNISIKGDEFRRTIIRPIDRVSQSPWRKMFFYRDAVIDALEIGVVDYDGTSYAPTGVSASISGFTSTIVVTLTYINQSGNVAGYQALLSWVGKVFTDTNTDNGRGNAKRGKAVVDSVSGNTMNCTVIYPFEGGIKLFAPDNWKLFSTKNYGYHYLTDPSNVKSTAKNNKDIDVLLCNEGNRVVGLTFQGQGGFAMVLDPSGNIKTKSPYIQECSSFSQSNNYKRFAGGQYIDGFAGRLFGTITEVKDNGLTVKVTGGANSGLDVRPPQAPCAFYVRGKRYQIDDVIEWTTVIDSQTGLPSSGTVTLTLDKTTTYLYDSVSQTIVFDLQKTQRDVRDVIDAAASDLALGTNYRSVHAGRRFLASYASALVGSLQDLTVAGINYAASQTSLSDNATFLSNISIMTNMLLNGTIAEPSITWSDINYGSDYVNKNLARKIIQQNRAFIIAEISSYISETEILSNFPKYNVLTNERDIGYIIDAITYDLVYGGTSQTCSTAFAFYDNGVSYVPSVSSICVKAFNRLKAMMPYIITNATTWGSISKSDSNTLIQNTSLTPSSVSFQATLDPLFNILLDYVVDGTFTPSLAQHCSVVSATVSGTQTGRYVVGDRLTVTGTIVVAYVSEVSMAGAVTAVNFDGPGSNSGEFTSAMSFAALPTVNSNVAVGAGAGALLTLVVGPETFPTLPTGITYPNTTLYNNVMGYTAITTVASNVITYLSNGANQQINIEMGGNRSMLGNDFAMFNDLAYGILANNGAFTEQVCTFTYYAHTGLWANNGSNLRGVGCSNSFGNYGLRASGFDVTELPDSVNLANHMIQTARIYKQGSVIDKMVPTATVPANEVWIIGYDHVPTNGSILEIDHSVNGEGIVSYIISSAQYTTIQVLSAIVIKLSLSSSGDNSTSSTGLKTALYHGQLVTIRSTNSFKFNNIDNVRPTRPSTALQYNDNLNSVYRVVSYVLSEATGDTLPNNTAILQSDNGFSYYSVSTDTKNISIADPDSGIYATVVSGTNSSTSITVNSLTPDTTILAGHLVSGIGLSGLSVVSVTGPVGSVYTIVLSSTPSTTPYGTVSFANRSQGSRVNDIKIAVNQISNNASIDQINKGTYITAWNGRLHRVLKYVNSVIPATGTLDVWTSSTNTLTVTDVVGNIEVDSLIIGRTSSNDATIEFSGYVSSSVIDNAGNATIVVNSAILIGVSSLSVGNIFTFGIPSNSYIELSPNAVINNNTIGSPIPALISDGSQVSYTNGNYFATFNIPYSKNNVLPVVNSFVTIAGSANTAFNGSRQVTAVVDQTSITIGSTTDFSVGMVVTFQIFVTAISGGNTFKTSTAHKLSQGDIVTFKETHTEYGVDSNVTYYVKTISATNGVFDKFTLSLTLVSPGVAGTEKTNFVNSTALSLEINTPISLSSHMNTATNDAIIQSISGNTIVVSPSCWAPEGAPVRATKAATVSTINIVDAGSGYTSAPTLSIELGGFVVQATATCTVSDGKINQVTVIIKGSGYVSVPKVIITPSSDTNTNDPNYSAAMLEVVLSTPVYKDSTSTSGITTSSVTLMYPTDPGTADSNEIKTVTNSTTATVGNSYSGTINGITYSAVSGYVVSLTFDALADAPTAGSWYKISGNSNNLYNGLVQVVSVGIPTSAIVFYPYDPGVAGAFTNTLTKITRTTTSATSSSLGISKPFATDSSYSFTIGYPTNVGGQVTTRISTCRATGHDFCDIGTGGYSTTNIPYSIYGDPSLSRQPTHETLDEGVGRCFYVSTNQDGIFRVGRFFSVDQGTGIVTLSSKMALSNVSAFGFSGGGAVVNEFSTDSTMTDNSTNKVPVESSVRGYIDKRLGLDHGGSPIPAASAIGPGFVPLNGITAMSGNLKMAGHSIIGLEYPGADLTAAATVGYVNTRLDGKSKLSQLTDDVTINNPVNSQLFVYDGVGTSTWVNVSVSGDVTLTYNNVSSTLTATIGAGKINNSMIKSDAAIVQSKLLLSAAATRATATNITQVDLGVASFNSSQFAATNGWVELLTSTSEVTGVVLSKLQFVPANKLLGNLSGSSAAVTTVSPGEVVTAGGGIKNTSFTAIGAMTVSSITNDGVNAYTVIPYTTTGFKNSVVQTDNDGAIDAQILKIDGNKALDSITTPATIQLFTPDGVIGLSATGATIAESVVRVTTLETTTNSGKVQTTNLTTGSPSTVGLVVGNWSVASGSRWDLSQAVTAVSADGLSASTDRVKIRPSLILDFANSRTLDPRVTFSRASTATCYNAYGVLITVANNQPRFDYDLAGISKGLLIEESRTNLLKYSSTFTTGTGNWTQTNFTSASAVLNAAPTKGSAIQFSSAVAFDGLLAIALSGISTSLTYVFSIWAKLVSGTATISISLDGTNWKTMNITSSLVRYTFPELLSTSASPTLTIKIPMNSQIVLWGAQFEQVAAGSVAFSTTYIKTDWETTSSTSNTVSTGAKTFIVAANAVFNVEKIPDASVITILGTGSVSLVGTVTSHIGTTLVVNITSVSGTGTAASWTMQSGMAQTRALEHAAMAGTNFSSWYRTDEGTMIVNTAIVSTRSGNYSTAKLQSSTDANSILLGCTVAPGTSMLTFTASSSTISFAGYTDTNTSLNIITASSVPLSTTLNAVVGFAVTFTFTALSAVPTVNTWYAVSGNSNALYNDVVQVTASTLTSVTVFYPGTSPGTYGLTGTTIITPVRPDVIHGIAYKANDCIYGYNGSTQTDSTATIDANINSLIIGNSVAGVGVQYVTRLTFYPIKMSESEMQRMTIQ